MTFNSQEVAELNLRVASPPSQSIGDTCSWLHSNVPPPLSPRSPLSLLPPPSLSVFPFKFKADLTTVVLRDQSELTIYSLECVQTIKSTWFTWGNKNYLLLRNENH